ncbi:hypothetical protein Tco_0843261 [Tanacetum coccineum]|uniref:Uncharacterized protein n=1 Tax=Tanacetum coccineum TaxID=301880 RepID=A0ABQ5B7D7_9ASTR
MNLQETQQVIARYEKWVPSTERVKISPTNVRLETTMHHKEETFQVIIDVIMNSMCVADAEVFRKIIDICLRVEGEEFNEVQDDDATLTILIDLVYKGPLHKHTNMYVDHMHQPWRTLEAVINKCLSGNTRSNDRLIKYRINILWGMFYKENVDYKMEKKSRPLKESKKTSRRQPGTGGSSEGTGRIPGVPDESIVVYATSSEGTGTKPGVLDEEKVTSKANVILEWGSEFESEQSEDSQLNFDEEEKKDNDGDADDENEDDDHINDIQGIDDENARTESDEDEIYKYKFKCTKM